MNAKNFAIVGDEFHKGIRLESLIVTSIFLDPKFKKFIA